MEKLELSILMIVVFAIGYIAVDHFQIANRLGG